MGVEHEDDIRWMHRALELAEQAAQVGEVPVGAVLVKDNHVIAEAYNQPIANHDPSAHAEVLVLRSAGEALQNYRLLNTTLYVTLEPCAMCVGAMHHARITRLVYGATDPKTGCVHSHTPLMNETCFHHRISTTSNVLADPASELLKRFFQARR